MPLSSILMPKGAKRVAISELIKNFYTIKELMEIRGVKDRQSVHDWLKRNNVQTSKLDDNIVVVLKDRVHELLDARAEKRRASSD